jgi:hypothetical protein
MISGRRSLRHERLLRKNNHEETKNTKKERKKSSRSSFLRGCFSLLLGVTHCDMNDSSENNHVVMDLFIASLSRDE